MWWIVGLVISGLFGIAQGILETLQKEVAVERKRWEDSYYQFQSLVEEQNRVIEQKIQTNRNHLTYKEVSALYHSSIKAADRTYALLQDCRKTLDAMGNAIVQAARQRKELEARKRNAWPWEKNGLEKQIRSLHLLRDDILIPDKNKVKFQRDTLLGEVRRLNRQTAELRDMRKSLPSKIEHQSNSTKWIEVTCDYCKKPIKINSKWKKPPKYHKECLSLFPSKQVVCNKCGGFFEINSYTQMHCFQKGYELPKKCNSCKKKRRKKR